MKRSVIVLAAACLSLGAMSVAQAKPPAVNAFLSFSDQYFSNNTTAGAPDATVRINNPGSTNGDLCAMIYVYDSNQEMNECCGCLTTPDGLRTLSVKNDINGNPLTIPLNTGTMKLISATVNGYPCDPTQNVVPSGQLNAWGTHVQNKVGTGFPITETGWDIEQLTPTAAAVSAELSSVVADCYFTQRLGSGRGVCSCGSGD